MPYGAHRSFFCVCAVKYKSPCNWKVYTQRRKESSSQSRPFPPKTFFSYQS